jgi:hypothetical protein
MENNQQTSVDWLIEQIEQYNLTHGPIPSHKLNELKKEANMIYREQIKQALIEGWDFNELQRNIGK